MAVRVPVYQPQVGIQALPGARVDAGNPGLAGEIAAQGKAAFAQGVSQAADALSQKALQLREKQDQAASQEALAGFMTWQKDYLYNPQTGLTQKRGAQAEGLYQSGTEEMQKKAAEILAGAKSKRQRELLTDALRQNVLQGSLELSRHEAAELKVRQEQAGEQLMSTALEGFVKAPDDTKATTTEGLIRRTLATNMGLPEDDPTVVGKVTEAMSKAHVTVVSNLVDQDKPEEAKAYLDAHLGAILGSDTGQITDKVNRAIEQKQERDRPARVLAATDGVLAKFGDKEDAALDYVLHNEDLGLDARDRVDIFNMYQARVSDQKRLTREKEAEEEPILVESTAKQVMGRFDYTKASEAIKFVQNDQELQKLPVRVRLSIENRVQDLMNQQRQERQTNDWLAEADGLHDRFGWRLADQALEAVGKEPDGEKRLFLERRVRELADQDKAAYFKGFAPTASADYLKRYSWREAGKAYAAIDARKDWSDEEKREVKQELKVRYSEREGQYNEDQLATRNRVSASIQQFRNEARSWQEVRDMIVSSGLEQELQWSLLDKASEMWNMNRLTGRRRDSDVQAVVEIHQKGADGSLLKECPTAAGFLAKYGSRLNDSDYEQFASWYEGLEHGGEKVAAKAPGAKPILTMDRNARLNAAIKKAEITDPREIAEVIEFVNLYGTQQEGRQGVFLNDTQFADVLNFALEEVTLKKGFLGTSLGAKKVRRYDIPFVLPGTTKDGKSLTAHYDYGAHTWHYFDAKGVEHTLSWGELAGAK